MTYKERRKAISVLAQSDRKDYHSTLQGEEGFLDLIRQGMTPFTMITPTAIEVHNGECNCGRTFSKLLLSSLLSQANVDWKSV